MFGHDCAIVPAYRIIALKTVVLVFVFSTRTL